MRSILQSAISALLVVVSTSLLSSASVAAAQPPLVVNAAEFGVGKFHRQDNKVHAYASSNAWYPFILPDAAPTDQPLVKKNADGSYTVFFSTLDELIASVVQIAKTENRQVEVLNLHGHGMPGAMWFPKDTATMNGWECADWKDAASGSDQANYDQYYNPVGADEVQQIRSISNAQTVSMPCTVGLAEWQAGVQKNPAFKAAIASSAQLHFLSCVVGLGTIGDAFTKGMADLLLGNGQGRIETSMDFGLGDWSMAQGMGFWDYLSDTQLNHDNSIYPVDHKDAEIAQPGAIRVAQYASGAWQTSQMANVSFMTLGYSVTPLSHLVPTANFAETFDFGPLPTSIRIPGTDKYIQVQATR